MNNNFKKIIEEIKQIKTENPGKDLLVDFLESYEGEITKELTNMTLFFAGMLATHDDLTVKSNAYERIAILRDENNEELTKIRNEILAIEEELSPTSVG